MQTNQDDFNYFREMLSFFFKQWAVVLLIFIGTITNIATKVVMKVKYTIWEWISLFIISSFAGAVVAIYCHYKGYLKVNEDGDLPIGLAIIPVTTLIGERVIMWAMKNYQPILNSILDVILRTRSKEN